ncbi:MAG: type III-B CRISPR module RAMP protein Cmr1 [Methanomassiliicoccales archaeon]|nr:type III-B CRISPR module RAMP protein Cmr1 [Methanomassiliicoccales archaeon]
MCEYLVMFKTLTPLWTGDAAGECNGLRETGILGSLRWWYEALVRGLGGYVCDPTDKDQRCDFGKKKSGETKDSDQGIHDVIDGSICPACQLFGCTGWARKFRIEVEGGIAVPEVSVRTRKKRNGKYLTRKTSGLMSSDPIAMRVVPLRKIEEDEWILLNRTLDIIANYGALGARTSQGCGVVSIVESDLPFGGGSVKDVKFRGHKKASSQNLNNFPNMKNFFFFKLKLGFRDVISNLINKEVFWTHASDDKFFTRVRGNWEKLWQDFSILPIAFHARDALRISLSKNGISENVLGKIGMGSKLFVSHGYKIDSGTVEMRIWGYGVGNEVKDRIKHRIKNALEGTLFAHDNFLQCCELVEEKAGADILGD